MRTRYIGLALTLALHGAAALGVLLHAPARNEFRAPTPPIMVELVAPTRSDAPPVPPTRPPKPRPVAPAAPAAPRPITPPPLLAAAPETAASADAASAPTAAAPATAAPAAPVTTREPAADSLAVTPPRFQADYLQNPAPAYPGLARRLGEQGRVILRVRVSAAGTAEDVDVRTSSGFPRLDEAARDAVRRWKFIPARRGDDPVAAWVLIPLSFRLEG